MREGREEQEEETEADEGPAALQGRKRTNVVRQKFWLRTRASGVDKTQILQAARDLSFQTFQGFDLSKLTTLLPTQEFLPCFLSLSSSSKYL